MGLQEVLVLFIVAAAAIYVARRAYQALRGGKPGCGSGCGKCPSGREVDDRGALLTIEPRSSREA